MVCFYVFYSLRITNGKESNMTMIDEVKDGPILQDSSQEPPMSSKYDFEDGVVLDTVIIMLEC